jgi:hypothetical protein
MSCANIDLCLHKFYICRERNPVLTVVVIQFFASDSRSGHFATRWREISVYPSSTTATLSLAFSCDILLPWLNLDQIPFGCSIIVLFLKLNYFSFETWRTRKSRLFTAHSANRFILNKLMIIPCYEYLRQSKYVAKGRVLSQLLLFSQRTSNSQLHSR